MGWIGHHPPELCLARKEFGAEAKRWIDGMNDLAKKLDIKIHGAYSSLMSTPSTSFLNQTI